MLINNLQPFQQWSNMKNTPLITEQKFLGPQMNSFGLNFWDLWWIPSLLSKKFKDNGSTSHDKVHKNAINQNEKP